MLYPIELLRHKPAADAARREGVHLNQQSLVCHVGIVLFACCKGAGLGRKSCILQ